MSEKKTDGSDSVTSMDGVGSMVSKYAMKKVTEVSGVRTTINADLLKEIYNAIPNSMGLEVGNLTQLKTDLNYLGKNSGLVQKINKTAIDEEIKLKASNRNNSIMFTKIV